MSRAEGRDNTPKEQEKLKEQLDKAEGRGRTSRISNEDRIETEVRKRLAERMSSAGIDSGRISMEVLYWLPPDFVRLYMALVSRALRMDAGVSSGIQGMVGDEGQVKAKVGTGPTRGKTAGGLFSESMTAQGTVEEFEDAEDGSGRKATGRRKKVVSGSHASGGGKRYRQHWLIRDEEAMELKTTIDRGLRKLAGKIERGEKEAREARDARAEGKWAGDRSRMGQPLGVSGGTGGGGGEGTHGDNPQTHGDNLRGERVLVVSPRGQKRCRTCGKIASSDWVICPHLHA